MKKFNKGDLAIDFLVLIGLAGIAVYLLPAVSAFGTVISLRLGRPFFWVHSLTLGHFLPHIFIGLLLGIASARLLRNRILPLALFPSILLCVFYGVYMTYGSEPYVWGQSRFDLVIVVSWVLLLSASLICAKLVLRRSRLSES